MTRRVFSQTVSTAVLAAGESSPLRAAILRGDLAAVKQILTDEPEAVNRSAGGKAPLQLAAELGKPEILMELTTRGATLTASAVESAVAHEDPALALDLATTLVANGAPITPKALRAADRHPDLRRFLDTRKSAYFGGRFAGRQLAAPPPGTTQYEVNQFVTLAHFDEPQVRERLAKTPGLLLAPATFDELAVEAAAHVGRADLTRFLADRGSPVSACTAVVLGENALFRRLIDEDPQRVRERGPHDQPLLMYTAFGKAPNLEAARLLLERKAVVDARGLGQTCMQMAVRWGHADLVTLLLDAGADVNAVSHSRIAKGTALDMAVRAKNEAMAKLLLSRGARPAG